MFELWRLLPFVLWGDEGIDSGQLFAGDGCAEMNTEFVDLVSGLFQLVPIVEFEGHRLGDADRFGQDWVVEFGLSGFQTF